MELFSVVDKDGNELRGVSRFNKRFYFTEPVAKGVATQYNNITVIKNGEGVQLPGAPFRVKRWEAVEA
jgi:hypothetical protein